MHCVPANDVIGMFITDQLIIRRKYPNATDSELEMFNGDTGRLVPRSELGNSILGTCRRRNKRIWKCIPIPNGLVSSIYPGRGSSIGSSSAEHASDPEFDRHVRHILPWRLGHEKISTAILPLPLIQGEQLSVTGMRTCTKYW